jgi:hypothetical protein
MSDLTTSEAAVLTQVASFPSLTAERRLKLLSKSSPRAKAIGRILVRGERQNDNPEYTQFAKRFKTWASQSEL